MYASKLISLLSAAFPQLIPLMANKSDLNSIWVTALDNYTSVFLLLPNEAAFHTEADCKPKCNVAHFFLILWYFIFCSPPLTSLCRNLIINIDNTARSWGRRKTNNSVSNVLLILYAFAVLSIKKKKWACLEICHAGHSANWFADCYCANILKGKRREFRGAAAAGVDESFFDHCNISKKVLKAAEKESHAKKSQNLWGERPPPSRIVLYTGLDLIHYHLIIEADDVLVSSRPIQPSFESYFMPGVDGENCGESMPVGNC